MDRDNALYDAYLKKWSSAEMTSNATAAASMLLGFELLRGYIVDAVKSFYCTVHPDEKEYAAKVLSLSEHQFEASCLWLVNCGALESSDIDEIQLLRRQRNRIAHDLTRLLLDPNHKLDTTSVVKVRHFIEKIGRFWARIDMDINPDFDGREIADSEIVPGSLLAFDLVLGALAGEMTNSSKAEESTLPNTTP